MTKKPIVIFLVLILAAVTVIVLLNLRHHAVPGSTAGTTAVPAATSTGTLFADSPYAAHAYLISATGTLSAAVQAALSGFSVQRQMLPDGTMQVRVSSAAPAGGTETYSVKSGEKLYFVENFMMDDASGSDRFLGDDKIFLVGADGMIQ
jgi:hypothetical protein